MAGELDVKAKISVEVDPKPIDALIDKEKQLADQHGKNSKAAHEEGQALEFLKEQAEALKKAFVELFVFAEVFAQVKEGIADVANLEATFNNLEFAAKRNGQSFEGVKEKIEEEAHSLSELAGIADKVSIPAMARVYQATGDINAAMVQAQIAGDAAVHWKMDDAAAFDLVFKVSQGYTKQLKELGIVIDENLSKHDKAVAGLKAIEERSHGAAAEASGLRIEWKRLGAEFEAWRDSGFGALEPILEGIVKGFRRLIAEAQASVDIIKLFGGAISTTFQAVWKAIKETATLNAGDAKKTMIGLGKDLADAAIEIEARYQELEKKVNDINDPKKKAQGRAKAEEGVIRGESESDQAQRLKQHLQAEAEALKAEAALYKGSFEALKMLREANQKEMEAALITEKGGIEKTEQEKDAIRRKFAAMDLKLVQDFTTNQISEFARQVEAFKKAHAEMQKEAQKTADMEKKLAELKAQTETNFLKKAQLAIEALDAWKAAELKKVVQDSAEAARQVEIIEEEDAIKRKEIARQLEKSKAEFALGAAQAAVGYMQTIFGNSTELAKLGILVDMAQGIMKAWAQWGDYPVVAAAMSALVVAAATAQAIAIDQAAAKAKSTSVTSPGAGFDNAANDILAEQYGMKWGRDLMRGMERGIGGAQRADGSRATESLRPNSMAVNFYNAQFWGAPQRQSMIQLSDMLADIAPIRGRRVAGVAT